MNMKKILIYGLTAVLTLGVGSCSDFLHEEPVFEQNNDLTLSSYSGLYKATMAAYIPLYRSYWYGAEFVLSAEIRSGNAKRASKESGRYIKEYNWNYSEAQTSNLFYSGYQTIAGANNVLNNLEGKESDDVTSQDLDNLKAECLFLRALAYFDMLRLYAQPYTYAPESLGVPLIYETEIGTPARNTVRECYDQVVKDLIAAEGIIADDFTRDDVTDKYSVVSKNAICALLSRVYLYMGEWQKCADYATIVINSGKYSMFTANEFADPNTWKGNTALDGKEIIFEVFGSKSNIDNPYWEEICEMTNPTGYADVAVSNDLYDLYEDGDARGDLFTIGFTDEGGTTYNDIWTLKYPGKGTDRPNVNNIPVLRLSEMYLNRAEAIARGASISGVTADSDLKMITSNRGAADVTATISSILLERRKELAFEGHYLYDLARTGTGVVRIDYDGTELTRNVAFPSYRWALPIPKHEIDCNPNMVQNEGY